MKALIMAGSSGFGPMLLLALIAGKSYTDSTMVQVARNTGIIVVLLGIQYTFMQLVRRFVFEAPQDQRKPTVETVGTEG